MAEQGRPLVADQTAARDVGAWWSRTLTISTVTLRSEFVRPPLFGQWAKKEWMRPAMRDLVQHRGHATRLYLAAMLEQQNLHPRKQQRWTADRLLDRHLWDDRLTSANELQTPSWATLLLGFTRRPPRGPAFSRWHRSRYEAVRNAFDRLAAVELFDPTEQVINSEHREWRWNSRIVDRRYVLPHKTEATFQIPVSLFTSGAYLRLSGSALYTVLAAFEYQQLQHLESCFQLHGFTWQTIDSAKEELDTIHLPTTFAQPLADLRQARLTHETNYTPQRPVARDDTRDFPRVVRNLRQQTPTDVPPLTP